MAVNILNGPLFVRLMSASVSAANYAGKVVRDIMKGGNLGIVEKTGINDLQTEADRSAQRCIVGALQKQFPKVKIIGEEDETLEKVEDLVIPDLSVSGFNEIKSLCPDELSIVKEEDLVVWVDPLDGTAEYTQGLLDHVTVLIGIAVNGKAVGGIINQPFFNYQNETDYTKLGRTMWGIVGGGARGIDHVLPPKDKTIITTTRSHSNQIINSTIDAIHSDEVLRVGGAGHKVLLLIEGKAHAYVFPSSGCKKWDTCAPEAILHALGGKLTDITGESIQYHAEVQHANSCGVLATYVASVHDSFIQKIPPNIREAYASSKL